MHRSIEPHPHHLRHAACIVTVGLVDLCLQHGPHVPRLNANHRQARAPLTKLAVTTANNVRLCFDNDAKSAALAARNPHHGNAPEKFPTSPSPPPSEN